MKLNIFGAVMLKKIKETLYGVLVTDSKHRYDMGGTMTEEDFAEMERAEAQKHDDKVRELQEKYDKLNDFSNSQVKKLLIKNQELKAQIEKMKCCDNCKYADVIGDYEPCNKCLNDNRWELAK